MNSYRKVAIAVFLFFPTISSAATLTKTRVIFRELGKLVGIAIPIIFALALLLFFWGVAKYIWSAGSDKDEGKKVMFWGVIALFVISSIWGLTNFISDALYLDEVPNQRVPSLGP